MKGQFGFEQIISLVVFISFVSYIFYTVFSNIPLYRTEMRNEELRSEAYQISELLVNDPGYPNNWNGQTLVRLGLSNHTENKTNFVSTYKLKELNSTCHPPIFEGYGKVRAAIDTDHQFSINISGINCPISVYCEPPSSIYRNKTSTGIIRRLFVMDEHPLGISSPTKCYADFALEIW